ncbi:hypothetical protein Q9L58_006245 [Maublancomyces gigas]|uniref:F-box domain-containing protein n=1 Tax=Discina gigas TaxID=1032678 RepID=A0ABR3GGD7_9PEZI
MACFSDLPNELLCKVCSHLGQQELAHVSLVSHNLRLVAEPFLYRDVLLNTFRKPPPLFGSFLQTIRSNRALPNYVQALALRWHSSPEPVRYPPSMNVWLFGMVMSIFAVTLPPLPPLPPHPHGESIMLLLRALPRLEVLRLWPANDLEIFDGPFPCTNPPVLEHLREVRCYWTNTRNAVDLATFMFLIMQPSLRTFEAPVMGSRPYSHVFMIDDYFIGKSMVTDLRLSYGYMLPQTLESVLQLPRALTSFSYTNLPRVLFDVHALGMMLKRIVSPTLQFLALTLGHESDVWNRTFITYHWPYSTIGSLREWPVLWSIRSSLIVLLGRGRAQSTLRLIDVLPVVIRELEIEIDPYWTCTEIADEVVEMLHLRGTGDFEQLAVITLPVEVYVAARWLGVACDVAGVELVLTRCW